jgi:tRNA-splicing ligase RtcB
MYGIYEKMKYCKYVVCPQSGKGGKMLEFVGKYTTAKVMIDSIDEMTAGQIIQMINSPAFTEPVAIMPDTHAGKGSVVGFTMPLADKIVPNTIGVDIGCGMVSVALVEMLKISEEEADKFIRDRIPFGKEVRDQPIYNMEKHFPWDATKHFSKQLAQRYPKVRIPDYSYAWFESLCNDIGMDVKRAVNSLGTLGGGNHFIEIGRSKETEAIWITVHTGSRQLGLKICNYWQNAPARKKQQQKEIAFNDRLWEIKATLKGKAISDAIKKARADLGMDNKVEKGLEYIEGADMTGYLADMLFAQVYASENRKLIMNEILGAVHGMNIFDTITSTHNYIDFGDFIMRKGAIASYKGQKMIIPFNMEDGILICEGKSNPEWNYSAPHGAGRIKSRAQAKKDCSAEVARKRMQAKGIYTSAIPVDEVKEAYKDPKIIEEAIEPTAEIIDRIIPIMNMKEGDGKEEE